MKRAMRLSSHKAEAAVMWSRNKTGAWMRSLPPERLRAIVREACALRSAEKRLRAVRAQVKQQHRMERNNATVDKNLRKEERHEERQRNELPESEEEVIQMLESMSNAAERRTYLKEKLRAWMQRTSKSVKLTNANGRELNVGELQQLLIKVLAKTQRDASSKQCSPKKRRMSI